MAIATAILGASGYSGQETLDRVLAHPELELVALGSDSLAGSPAGALDPRLNGSLPAFVTNEEALAAGAELVFCCLEHERAAALDAARRRRSSSTSPGAHRLDDASLYPGWYGFEHPAAGSLGEWSYAIPELFPPEGPLIANPGCYATAVLLALAPLVDSIEPTGVVVDAKSGVSGAGRTLKASSHAGSVLENVSPYKIGSHQHAPEIEQALGFPVCFVPHLLPVRRGLLATCYVTATADLREALDAAYAAAPAVTVLPEGIAPELSRVQGTDGAELGVFTDRSTGTGIVVCAIDNLGKGAAGQAVQNANLALGPARDGRPPALRGAGMSVTAAEGLRRRRRARGDPAQGPRPRRRPLDRARGRRRDVHGQPRPRGAGRRLEAASRGGRAAGDRDQLRRRERCHRRARRAGRARDRRRGGPAARPACGGGARPLHRRDRRAAAAREGARRPPLRRAGAHERRAAATPPRRS